MHGTLSNPFFCDAPRTGDPTGTFPLRRKWKRSLGRQWQHLQTSVRNSIGHADMLGLGSITSTSLAFHAVGSLAGMTSGVKIKAFQSFFDDQMKNAVMQGDGSFLDDMVHDAYMMGIKRGLRLAKLDAVPFELQNNIPHNIDGLSQLAVVELQGIVEAVSQSSVRMIADGILTKQKPMVVARSVNDRIAKIGITRSDTMIDVIVIRAFNNATLDLFQAASVRQVGVVPETYDASYAHDEMFSDAGRRGAGSRTSRRRSPSRSTIYRIRRQEHKLEELRKVRVATAGDNRVCEICEELESHGPYTIDHARSLIPAHARCRCAFIPA